MKPSSHPRTPSDYRPGFWETRAFVALLVLLSVVPLLWPDVPPLVDLPGHVGRYRVQIDLEHSPFLQRYYGFEWALIGNLGVDLLVMPLAKAIGLEAAVKLIVLSIPALTTAGLLWVAKEVHGRVEPAAFFALPLAYNFPFLFGFVNFALSMALALLAFGLWLRLARLGRLRTRAALFVPISIIIWLTHTFGWGTLGVMAFSAELVRQADLRRPLFKAAWKTVAHCLALTPPMLLMLAWRSGEHVTGQTGDWFNWSKKLDWLLMALRDRWQVWDQAALAVIALLLLVALFHRRLEYSRNLAASAIFLALVYVLLPRIVFGSNYADMRLVPYLIAVAVIAIRFRPTAGPGAIRLLAFAGLAFFAARTAATTASFWLYDEAYDRELAALHHVPVGARMVSFVGRPCREPWAMSRLAHIPALAIVRKQAFSNDQWVMGGAQLLRVRYRRGWPFINDPSQMVTRRQCPRERFWQVDQALQRMPRGAFDYVWLIAPPPYDPRLAQGLRPIWRSGRSVLFRVER